LWIQAISNPWSVTSSWEDRESLLLEHQVALLHLMCKMVVRTPSYSLLTVTCRASHSGEAAINSSSSKKLGDGWSMMLHTLIMGKIRVQWCLTQYTTEKYWSQQKYEIVFILFILIKNIREERIYMKHKIVLSQEVTCNSRQHKNRNRNICRTYKCFQIILIYEIKKQLFIFFLLITTRCT
jgi:hypothetical protein